MVAKLRREILENIGSDKAPSFEDIRNCSFLQKTISETLRLYPAVPYNVRLALKDTTLPHGGGPDGRQPVGIKKDTPIGEPFSCVTCLREPLLFPGNVNGLLLARASPVKFASGSVYIEHQPG